ncbi:TaqI-like C-terminal specificity domain-containing protein [Clostridium malenominatum]|uniref:site-specific DNA-methyltransferase (adenine-specific) n=1 Tax=Clostridium malenominatum TaxID=1539 RepID=A0ABN1IP24_9CLOT
MLDLFIKKIEELYNIILQPIDYIFKEIAVMKYKQLFYMSKEENFGEKYLTILKDNKNNGVVYTPLEISNYMIKNTIKLEEIINNPFIKILDPSCGCGNIIIPLYKCLYELYKENLDEINIKNNIKLNDSNLKEHIIKNNIFGIDIDEIAIKVLCIDLYMVSNVVFPSNFKCEDFLEREEEGKFNIIIGNPPYVGHKTIDKEYSKNLKEKYGEVFKDKGDLSYTFFKGALMNCSSDGKVTFVTSRYFIEAHNGKGLRKYIVDNYKINKIMDFYGIRPFKNIGVDPVILFLEVKGRKIDLDYSINIIKPKSRKSKEEFIKYLFLGKEKKFNSFYLTSKELNTERWLLIEKNELNIVKKIENKCNLKLKEICESNQGIITGCDKAFIVNSDYIEKNNLEKDIIKPWIKSSNIDKYKVDNGVKFIIYLDKEENIENFPNIKKHLEPYKEILIKRRECKKGVRKWYELQWGRKSSIFEEEKIIFPYKSKENKFALDLGSYYSADIYSIKLKDIDKYDYNFLLRILNSRTYQFYFQCFGKKLGEDLYEYYPNTLMELFIPEIFPIENNNEEDIYNYFDFSEEEIKIIGEDYV